MLIYVEIIIYFTDCSKFGDGLTCGVAPNTIFLKANLFGRNHSAGLPSLVVF